MPNERTTRYRLCAIIVTVLCLLVLAVLAHTVWAQSCLWIKQVSINGGVARPNVRLLIEWAELNGSLLDSITIENPVTATADADVTLILGGDGVTP